MSTRRRVSRKASQNRTRQTAVAAAALSGSTGLLEQSPLCRGGPLLEPPRIALQSDLAPRPSPGTVFTPRRTGPAPAAGAHDQAGAVARDVPYRSPRSGIRRGPDADLG